MRGRADWGALRARRLAEPGAKDAYEAARLAFELGRSVRQLREQRGWSQGELARQAGMTQPAVARFEAGGTVPTLPMLERLARALGVELAVSFPPSIVGPQRRWRSPRNGRSRRCTRARRVAGVGIAPQPRISDVDHQHLVVVQRHYEPVQQDEAIVDGLLYLLEAASLPGLTPCPPPQFRADGWPPLLKRLLGVAGFEVIQRRPDPDVVQPG